MLSVQTSSYPMQAVLGANQCKPLQNQLGESSPECIRVSAASPMCLHASQAGLVRVIVLSSALSFCPCSPEGS